MLENNGVTKEEKNWSDTANLFFCNGLIEPFKECISDARLLKEREESEKVDRFGIINCHVNCQASSQMMINRIPQ